MISADASDVNERPNRDTVFRLVIDGVVTALERGIFDAKDESVDSTRTLPR